MSARREENVPSDWGSHEPSSATHRPRPRLPGVTHTEGTPRHGCGMGRQGEMRPGFADPYELLPVQLRTAVGRRAGCSPRNPSPKHSDLGLQKILRYSQSWFGLEGWFFSVNFCSYFLNSQASSFRPSSTNNSQRNFSFCLFGTCSLARFATFSAQTCPILCPFPMQVIIQQNET